MMFMGLGPVCVIGHLWCASITAGWLDFHPAIRDSLQVEILALQHQLAGQGKSGRFLKVSGAILSPSRKSGFLSDDRWDDRPVQEAALQQGGLMGADMASRVDAVVRAGNILGEDPLRSP
jgi:hypothetical protein